MNYVILIWGFVWLKEQNFLYEFSAIFQSVVLDFKDDFLY